MAQKIRSSIKVDFGEGLRLGAGKIKLLEMVADTGSISAAARAMDMSYRRAWLLIEEANQMFKLPVVETVSGGSGGGGAKITEHGRHVVTLFHELQKEADSLVEAKFANLSI